MRIFYGFLILFFSALLWLVPISDGIYEFRTDAKTDTAYIQTGAGETSSNHTLTKTLYDNDTSSVSLFSYDSDDIPVVSSYNSTTRLLVFTGMAASTNRTMEITFDTDVFTNSNFWPDFLDNFKFYWWVFISLYAIGALVAMFRA